MDLLAPGSKAATAVAEQDERQGIKMVVSRCIVIPLPAPGEALRYIVALQDNI
jgi:hypothetical protein